MDHQKIKELISSYHDGELDETQRKMIERILKMRSLFRRKPIEDTKLALLEIIHLMDSDMAYDTLEPLVTGSSGKLRKAAEVALKKVKDADRDDPDHQ